MQCSFRLPAIDAATPFRRLALFRLIDLPAADVVAARSLLRERHAPPR